MAANPTNQCWLTGTNRKCGNEDSLTPFYFLVNAEHSLSPFKVVWKYISGEISGKGEFFVSAVSTLNDDVSGNLIVAADHRLMVVPCGNEREADYVAGALNSSLVRLIVKSYTIETAISTHVLKNVRVPRFDPVEQIACEYCESFGEGSFPRQ